VIYRLHHDFSRPDAGSQFRMPGSFLASGGGSILESAEALGWNTARNQAALKTTSRIVAIAVFLGFASVPISVLAGWVH